MLVGTYSLMSTVSYGACRTRPTAGRQWRRGNAPTQALTAPRPRWYTCAMDAVGEPLCGREMTHVVNSVVRRDSMCVCVCVCSKWNVIEGSVCIKRKD